MKEEYRYTSFCECTVEAPMYEDGCTPQTKFLVLKRTLKTHLSAKSSRICNMHVVVFCTV